VPDEALLRAFRLRVRLARLKLKLSQEEAAERVGLPLRTYQLLEAEHARRTNPSLETILALSQRLGIPVGRLLAAPSASEAQRPFPQTKRPRQRKSV
jgi:transcriptional regulator with XRE-family HTH domain